MLKVNGTASVGSHGKYIKYVSFLWPPDVAAHGRKRLARELYSKLLALEELSLYPGFSYVHQIIPFRSNSSEDDFRLKLCLV
jgi:hypothetical protein